MFQALRPSGFPKRRKPSTPGPKLYSSNALDKRLVQVDLDGDAITGIPAVVQVIAVVRVDDINVIVVVPVVGPIFRPRINETEPKAAVLEARVATNQHHGVAVDAEEVIGTKVTAIAVVWNAVAVITAALPPVAVLRLPVVCAMLLPGAALFAFLPVLLLRGLPFDLLRMGLLVIALTLLFVRPGLLLLLFLLLPLGFLLRALFLLFLRLGLLLSMLLLLFLLLILLALGLLLRMLLLLFVRLGLLLGMLLLLFLLLILLALGLLLRMLLLLFVRLGLLLGMLLLFRRIVLLLTLLLLGVLLLLLFGLRLRLSFGLGLFLLLRLGLLFLFRGFSAFFLFFLACVGRNSKSQKQEECCRTDRSKRFHEVAFLTANSCARPRMTETR